MAEFIVQETREIIKGYYTLTFQVEADSYEEAEKKVSEYDEDAECINHDFDIRDSEHISFSNET